MDNSDLTKLAFDISNSLATLNANMESVLSKMADHEHRLHVLEGFHTQQPKNKDDENFKDELLKLLARATIIGLVVIGSLSGAGGIIAKILTM